MHNSPLREEPREQRAAVIPPKNESSLLDWLYSSGRLISRDNQEAEYLVEEEDDVAGLLESDEVGDLYDDDDEILLDDEE